jgi:hypothetical protein
MVVSATGTQFAQGIWAQANDAQSYTGRFDHGRIIDASPGVNNSVAVVQSAGSTLAVSVASSQLSGGTATTSGGSTLSCIYDYSATNTALGPACN